MNVLINGGSRGIGKSMVETFALAGHRVAFTYKNSEEEAKLLAERLGVLAIRADSACEGDVVRAVKLAAEGLGGIDCLINNAAVSSFSLLSDISLETWNNTLAVNLTGPFLYTREAVPYMLKNKWGRIINVSSMWGVVGASCESHYSAAKAGLIGLTKSLAKELGPSGITVNAIAPGVIDTDMNKELTEDDTAELCDKTPVMRVGKPSEVAEAALFLAGESSGFITGEVMNVSGGFVVY